MGRLLPLALQHEYKLRPNKGKTRTMKYRGYLWRSVCMCVSYVIRPGRRGGGGGGGGRVGVERGMNSEHPSGHLSMHRHQTLSRAIATPFVFQARANLCLVAQRRELRTSTRVRASADCDPKGRKLCHPPQRASRPQRRLDSDLILSRAKVTAPTSQRSLMQTAS